MYKESILTEAIQSKYELIDKESFANQADIIVEQKKQEVSEKLHTSFTPASFAQLDLDASLFQTSFTVPNENNIFYWKVTARKVGEEMLVRVIDRKNNDTVVAEKYCPLRVATVLLQTPYVIPWTVDEGLNNSYYKFEYGFNADAQSAYAIKVNGNRTLSRSTYTGGYPTCIALQTLEIKDLTGEENHEVVLGEFYASSPALGQHTKKSLIVITTPIPV